MTRVGVIGAMDVEVEYLTNLLEAAECAVYAGMTFTSGRIGDLEVVIAQCGVGKVCAAMCVQVLAERYAVTHVVNTGAAGSLDARIDIGDLVVSTDAIQHDMDVTQLGYKLGQVPGLPEGGFAADEALADAVVRAAQTAASDCAVFRGRVASGDQFVARAERKRQIVEDFSALCCEMEGAAIAQACYLNAVPFVIVRAISDKADGSDAEAYDEFEAKAAVHCAHLVEQLLKDWSVA